mmetsp:Transcript_87676/g.146135  ORF Transcript_87676/g.146135 Transcript_87676/m.146135 type:complete len:131 (+) Transcript_87676:1602-1994(+)
MHCGPLDLESTRASQSSPYGCGPLVCCLGEEVPGPFFFFFCATHRTVDAHALHHIGAVLPRCLFAQQPTTKELYGTVMFLRNSDHAAPNLLWLSVLQIYQVDLQKMPYMNRSEHECMYTEFLCIVERRSS